MDKVILELSNRDVKVRRERLPNGEGRLESVLLDESVDDRLSVRGPFGFWPERGEEGR